MPLISVLIMSIAAVIISGMLAIKPCANDMTMFFDASIMSGMLFTMSLTMSDRICPIASPIFPALPSESWTALENCVVYFTREFVMSSNTGANNAPKVLVRIFFERSSLCNASS